MDTTATSKDRSRRPLFLLTVDTEEEWDWHGDFPQPPCSTNNIDELPKFQELCSSNGVRPTYFIDYAVAEVPRHVDTIKQFLNNNECDVGAHLHPWCTPPLDGITTQHSSHSVNLELDLFRKKMESLTELLRQTFDIHPYSFRSGRWGINGPMLKVLSDLGYGVDSSVRPFYDHPDVDYFDYTHAKTRPYHPSFKDALKSDEHQEGLLEIPTSSGFNHSAFEFLNSIHSTFNKAPFTKLRLIGILWQLGLMRKITLTPEDRNAKDLIRCMDMCVKRGDGIINLFLHSSNFLPGNTPYVRTSDDRNKMFGTIAACINHAREKHQANFVTMREAGALLNPAKN